jgi:hypothetical protein
MRRRCAAVGLPRLAAEFEVALDELPEAEMLGQGGWQQQPGVGHELRPVERQLNPVEAVEDRMPAGAPLLGWWAVRNASIPVPMGTCTCVRIVNQVRASVDPG